MAETRFWMIVIAIIVHCLPYFFVQPLTVLYIQHRVCEQIQHGEHCDSSEVSSKAAVWSTIANVFNMGLGALVVSIVGPRTDTAGRKLLLILPAAGNIACYSLSVVVTYMDLSLWIFLISFFISGIMGGLLLFLTGIQCSISDITSTDSGRIHRTTFLSIVEGLFYLCIAVGSTLSGVAADHLGFPACFAIAAGVEIFAFSYICFLPESLPSEKRQPGAPWGSLFAVVRNLTVLGRSATSIGVAIAFMVIATTIPLMSTVAILFVRHVYDWSRTTTGLFIAAGHTVKGIGCVVVLPLLKKHVPRASEKHLLMVCMLLQALVFALTGAIHHPAIAVWIVQLIWLGGGLAFPLGKAILSKLSPDGEQGKLFSALGLIESTIGLISSPLMQSGIYANTCSLGCAGCAYFVGAAMVTCVAVPLLFLKSKDPDSSDSSREILPENTSLSKVAEA